MTPAQIAVSPCSNPELALDEVLAAYARRGYRNVEVFTSWVKSAFDPSQEPSVYLAEGQRNGLRFTSFHLPRIDRERVDETLAAAIRAARFAEAVGAETVIFKANDRRTYVDVAPAFLDALSGLRVVPVVQNHFGTVVSSLEDVREVMDGIADPRLRSLLEVGHFHSAGVPWRRAVAALGDAIALVHIKDQVGKQSVPFGAGEIDLPGLIRHLDAHGYRGRYVVEMEVRDKENTHAYLGQALAYVLAHCGDNP
jgi:inosose dehydratase